jgi:hypothetical protein
MVLMDLVKKGALKPLHICKVFSFDKVADAFRYMQHGKHLGKIVVSFENSHIIKVPVRPAVPVLKLNPDVSYFISGGFKGLCGSLALYLARHGAKNIVVMARSGYDDAGSQSIIYNLNAMGCHVDLVKGDITKIEDVRRAFQEASKPIGGVIQGAMVLRVSNSGLHLQR